MLQTVFNNVKLCCLLCHELKINGLVQDCSISIDNDTAVLHLAIEMIFLTILNW